MKLLLYMFGCSEPFVIIYHQQMALAFIRDTGCEDVLTYVLASDNHIETKSEQVQTPCPSDVIWAL